jgi:hypothetical protein
MIKEGKLVKFKKAGKWMYQDARTVRSEAALKKRKGGKP